MKKYLIFIIALIAVIIGGYFYVYKVHRNIEAENEAYNGKVESLFLAYQQDESQSNLKYLDKTIVVSGKITSINVENKTLVLDAQLYAVLKENSFESITVDDEITIKGRLLGFDSLLEELKLDQCVIIK